MTLKGKYLRLIAIDIPAIFNMKTCSKFLRLNSLMWIFTISPFIEMLLLRKQKKSTRDTRAALAYSKEFTQSLIMVPPPLPCLTGKF